VIAIIPMTGTIDHHSSGVRRRGGRRPAASVAPQEPHQGERAQDEDRAGGVEQVAQHAVHAHAVQRRHGRHPILRESRHGERRDAEEQQADANDLGRLST
jgi:hypothetical protein